MTAPINKMVDSVVRCTICGAGYGKCDCWTKCGKCGWMFEKGTKCRNCEHNTEGETVSLAMRLLKLAGSNADLTDAERVTVKEAAALVIGATHASRGETMTYEQLIAHCRRTLDLHPERPIDNLREFGSIVAHNIPKPATAATYYAHLYYNLVEYIELHREIESQP